ncbi:MAG: septum formation family protein [Ornithinimicrobium sp.]|uniref:septum formation family protein n=1 Tax=Ornithinimicrobium sp. TaxID=1977084 RepID=UPI00182596C5|nr:septum formation family protein [Actinomycetota bacterium]
MLSRPFVPAALVAAVLSAAGCGLLDPAPSAEVGDCVDMATLQEEEVTEIPTVDCTQEHDGQLAVSFQMPEGDYPSDQEFQDALEEECLSGFEEFIGTGYADSSLEIYDLSPTQESWDAGDRRVLCLVYLPDDTTTESFEGSGL